MEREITIRTLSPLVLRADRSRLQHNPGLDYIPGSSMRGALAALYLQRRANDDVFRAVFTDGQASVGDLLPSTHDMRPGHLLPASARACKYDRLKHPASLTDSLLRLAAADTFQRPELVQGPWERCPDCDRRRDRISGYVTAASRDYGEIRVKKRVLAGTAIQRSTGTAETGMLYSQEAIEEDQLFCGSVTMTGRDAVEKVQELESVAPAGQRLSLGAGRSRGTGLVEIAKWQDTLPGLPLERRVEAFNSAWSKLAGGNAEACASLTLTSHLLLRDRTGSSVTSLDGRRDLDSLFGLPGIKLGRHIVVPAVVRGWNALLGLPKEDEPAIGRGSVILLFGPVASETVRSRFEEIEAGGLGRRRAEGFGRLRVCDPFHVNCF